MENLHLPYQISLPFTIGLGTVEMFAGLMVLIPRFRRGAGRSLLCCWSASSFISASTIRPWWGRIAPAFPWLKRAINPWFFPEDGAMIAVLCPGYRLGQAILFQAWRLLCCLAHARYLRQSASGRR